MNVLKTTDIYTLNQMDSMTCELYLNKISIKKKINAIPAVFRVETDKLKIKFIEKYKGPRIVKIILGMKKKQSWKPYTT